MKKTRSDKKFNVKVWVKSQDKDIFRSHCFEYHLSMMFVAEKYLIVCLRDFSDAKLNKIIEDNLEMYQALNSKKDGFEALGLRLTNDYWQKLAYFAVRYKTSVAKIGSCLFNYCLSSYELQIEEEFGLVFSHNKKKRYRGLTREDINERTSDY